MAFDIILVDAEGGRDRVLYGLRILGGGVDERLAVLEIDYRRRRLHGRMRQVWDVIFGLVNLSALGEFGVNVADVPHDLLRLADGFEERLFVYSRVIARVLARFPIQFEFLAALHRGPGVVGDHRHAAQSLESVRRFECGKFHDLLHAANFPRLLVVVASQLAAEDRRPRDRSVDHARHRRVDAEGPTARANVVAVYGRSVFADVAILRRGFELQFFFFRHGLFCRRGRQFAVAQLPPAPRVNDLVVLSFAFGDRSAPLRRRRAFQHHSGARPGLAHRVVKIADRAGAVRVLIAVFLVPDGLFDLYARPIGVKLVS